MLIASAIALYDFTNEDQEIGLFYLLVFTDQYFFHLKIFKESSPPQLSIFNLESYQSAYLY